MFHFKDFQGKSFENLIVRLETCVKGVLSDWKPRCALSISWNNLHNKWKKSTHEEGVWRVL